MNWIKGKDENLRNDFEDGGSKMKKGVVIGASEESEYVICTAKQLGIEVIALDGNPNAKGFLYSDDSVVVDIKNKELVSKIIQEIKPDFILPVPIGRHLSTVGYINGKFGLKGIKFTPVKNSVDKLLFHEILNSVC